MWRRGFGEKITPIYTKYIYNVCWVEVDQFNDEILLTSNKQLIILKLKENQLIMKSVDQEVDTTL